MVYNYDENGEMTEIFVNPFEKLATIKAKLEKDLQTIKRRYEANENSQYPRKLNFNVNIVSSVLIACNSFPKVPYKYAVDVDVQIFKDNVSAFMELWEWIKGYYPDFVCSKTLFTNFMGISASAYSFILTNSTDADLASEIEQLNDILCEVEISAAQFGTAKEKTTTTKLGAGGVGYGMDLKTMPESVTINNNLGLGASEVKKQLESILGVGLIEGKGKK